LAIRRSGDLIVRLKPDEPAIAESRDREITKSSWLVWQLADSAFPAGGFAHSFGLEAAWQQGEVTRASLPSFVGDVVAQAGHSGLPFVISAHDDPADLPAVDQRCEVFLRNPVANRASRVQGRAWLGTVERSFPTPAVHELCEAIRSAGGPRHFSPAFGATLRTLDVDRQEASRLFLFGAARGTLSAAVRLGIVGTMDAQRMLWECSEHLDRAMGRYRDLAIDEAAQTSPLIDLWQASHDRLYSRLFQS
jgi:urease accessory protein